MTSRGKRALARLERWREVKLNLGATIRDAREGAGLTRADLARLLKVKWWVLQRWETGLAIPREPTLESLCKALGKAGRQS